MTLLFHVAISQVTEELLVTISTRRAIISKYEKKSVLSKKLADMLSQIISLKLSDEPQITVTYQPWSRKKAAGTGSP